MTLIAKYHPIIKSTHAFNKERIPLSDLAVELSNKKLATVLFTKATDKHYYIHYISSHSILRNVLYIVKH